MMAMAVDERSGIYTMTWASLNGIGEYPETVEPPTPQQHADTDINPDSDAGYEKFRSGPCDGLMMPWSGHTSDGSLRAEYVKLSENTGNTFEHDAAGLRRAAARSTDDESRC
jgi:hypothetical protein